MTKLITIVTVVLIALANSVFGQTSYKNKKWTLENVELKDFDLIGKAIGNSRIVMLGEQDHGDGETFKKKTNLVKYLIENKGFNVIAFESDFFAINKISEKDLPTDEKVKLVTDQLHGIWRRSNEFLPLMDYISQSIQIGREIILTGFDSQHHSKYTKTNYVDYFKTILTNNEIVIDETFFEVLAMFIKDGFKYKPKETEIELFNSTLEMIEAKLVLFTKTSEIEFWLQELRSLKGDFKEVSQGQGKGLSILNKRDLQMASNLEYLARIKFGDKKIIVWAANYHIAKNPEKVSWSKQWNPKKDSLITMGDIIEQSLGNVTYSIAFICGQGYYTNWVENDKPLPIIEPFEVVLFRRTLFLSDFQTDIIQNGGW
jgi:erythromycin esterase-like protein